MMVAGIVIARVGKENTIDEKRVHAAYEHVMSVNHVAEKRDRHHRINDDPGAEQRPAHVGDQHVRDDAHGGHDRNIDLRMSEEPKEMLPQQGRSAGMGL